MPDSAALNRLNPGEAAPNFRVQLVDGGETALADYHGRRLLLVFVRHLACLPCQEHLREIVGELPAISATGADVLVVSFDTTDKVSGYALSLGLNVPVASDDSRSTYRAYGLLSASFWNTWHPRTLWRYIKLLSQGRKLQRPEKGSDLSQLGADFVIDSAGVIVYAHYSERPDDRPAIEEIVRAVASTQE